MSTTEFGTETYIINEADITIGEVTFKYNGRIKVFAEIEYLVHRTGKKIRNKRTLSKLEFINNQNIPPQNGHFELKAHNHPDINVIFSNHAFVEKYGEEWVVSDGLCEK